MTANEYESPNIGIIEAVETLSSLADMDEAKDIAITQKHTLAILDKDVTFRTVHWMHDVDHEETIEVVRDTFRAILTYLQGFYEQKAEDLVEKEELEGIKTIMVLVGEAAQKLDKFTTLFKGSQLGSVTKLKEYQQLQAFYKKKLAKRIEEEGLTEKLKGYPYPTLDTTAHVKLKGKAAISPQQQETVDLDQVKRDIEYELFLMRKEDGSEFFTPRMIRSMKLVCDFGDAVGEPVAEDVLTMAPMWLDSIMQISAKNILKMVSAPLDVFYHEALKNKENELVSALSRCMMALLLSANPRNLLRNTPVKCCSRYFSDFQLFLREALVTREFQKLVAYPPDKGNPLGRCLYDLTSSVCTAFFVGIRAQQALLGELQDAIQQGQKEVPAEASEGASWWNHLTETHDAVDALVKRHPHGPLNKVLNYLETSEVRAFDPLVQGNIPNLQYEIVLRNHHILVPRLPSPTHQEFIHNCSVTDEFKVFLRAYGHHRPGKHHLMINLQDRTQWRERKRCVVLEELQKHKDFKDALTVVTLAKDTDFYHQTEPYHNLNHADAFLAQFKEHLADDNSGYFFPAEIRKALFPQWIDATLTSIHQLFFSGKNVLLRNHRLDFIEIFYLLVQLKLMEITRANSFSLTCKDGIDTGSASCAQLYAFLRIINGNKWSKADAQVLNMILYMPALTLRERNIAPNRFDRMASCIKAIESIAEEIGRDVFTRKVLQQFHGAFDHHILNAKVHPFENSGEV